MFLNFIGSPQPKDDKLEGLPHLNCYNFRMSLNFTINFSYIPVPTTMAHVGAKLVKLNGWVDEAANVQKNCQDVRMYHLFSFCSWFGLIIHEVFSR